MYLVPLAIAAARISALESILSPDERERAQAFKRQEDAQRYIVTRASLRRLLAAYLRIEPAAIRFEYGAMGKPHLAAEFRADSYHFSVSHCAELALLGFTPGHRIGVDLESLANEIDFDDIAERYFSAGELASLRSMPREERKEAFYRGWTRKEAYLKARGEGLSYPLEDVEVSLTSNAPASLLKVRDDSEASRHWVIEHLAPASHYIGAAAVETARASFAYFKWVPE